MAGDRPPRTHEHPAEPRAKGDHLDERVKAASSEPDADSQRHQPSQRAQPSAFEAEVIGEDERSCDSWQSKIVAVDDWGKLGELDDGCDDPGQNRSRDR